MKRCNLVPLLSLSLMLCGCGKDKVSTFEAEPSEVMSIINGMENETEEISLSEQKGVKGENSRLFLINCENKDVSYTVETAGWEKRIDATLYVVAEGWDSLEEYVDSYGQALYDGQSLTMQIDKNTVVCFEPTWKVSDYTCLDSLYEEGSIKVVAYPDVHNNYCYVYLDTDDNVYALISTKDENFALDAFAADLKSRITKD